MDTLSSYSIGEIVDLLQIIAVGKQSVGKLSVLEAISHIQFPIALNIYTYFAIEIVLSIVAQTYITISICFNNKSKLI